MHTPQKISLFLIRVSMGWIFFYAGITKVMNPEWSAASYLEGAKAFNSLFDFFLSPNVLPIVNLLNAWGLTLIGVSLILGLFVRVGAPLGMLLMVLYYLPLGLPKPSPTSYIVDQHVIYFLVLGILYTFRAGRFWGLERE